MRKNDRIMSLFFTEEDFKEMRKRKIRNAIIYTCVGIICAAIMVGIIYIAIYGDTYIADEIRSYDVITANGVEYDAEKVDKVYQNISRGVVTSYTIYLDDGTKIVCTNYTLTNRN